MKRNLALLLLLAAASLLLSACELNMLTDVSPDGSGSFTYEMGFTPDEITTLSAGGGDICTQMQQESSGLPQGYSFTQETRGEDTFCVMTVPFADLDELRTIYAGMDMTVNQLSIDGNRFVYDVDMDLSGDASMMPGIAMRVRLTVPGTVGEHNADEVDGRTLTWNLVVGQANNLRAESAVTDNTTWYIVGGIALFCLCCGGLLVIAGVIFFLVRRGRSQNAPAVTG